MDYYNTLRIDTVRHIPQCTIMINRKFNFYALNFCASGTIEWSVNHGRKVFLTGPVAYWTLPGVHYRYGCQEPRHWDQYYVILRGTGSKRIFEQGLAPHTPLSKTYFSISNASEYQKMWQAFLHSFHAPDSPPGQIQHLLESLFLYLHRTVEKPGSVNLKLILEKSVERWQKIVPASINWDKEARELGFSSVHFRRIFKKHFGYPPGTYLLKLRLDKAARLLRETEIPVKDIAAECDFDDLYHFSKSLKQSSGLSPRHYREEMGLFRKNKCGSKSPQRH